MGRLNGVAAVQIGDGAGYPENAVIAAGGESHAVKGALHEFLTSFVQRAVLDRKSVV